ncbi:MAG TPA: AMP-binding protein [Stenomitos sp.]
MNPRGTFPGTQLLQEPIGHLGLLSLRLERAYGDLSALQIQRGGSYRQWSYRSFARRVWAMAQRLGEMGLQPGDRLALIGDNSPEWVMAYFAIVSVGAIAVPLDPQLSEEELCHLLGHCEARGAFAGERLIGLVTKALGEGQPVIGLTVDEFEREADEPFPVPPEAAETASILYTSGTTGSPKGVMLTHENLLFDAGRCAEVLYVLPGDNVFALLPLHHAYAFTCLLIMLLSGVPATFPLSLKPDSIVATMRDTRVTALPAVPLVIDHLARGIQERIEAQPPVRTRIARTLIRLSGFLRPWLGVHVSRRLCAPILRQLGPLRAIIAGGAALNPDSAEFFYALGVTVLNGYGLTETAPVSTLTPTPWRPGDGVGKPLRGVEIRVRNPNAEGIGEVLIRGPHVMRGYYRNPEGTAEVLEDGWLNTRDLGCLDERGNLHLMGRSKHVIVLPSGKNLYPEDVELHYLKSDLIQELCIITGTEADGSEFPFGVIVPNRKVLEAQHPEATTPKAVSDLIGKELVRLSRGVADYKRLKRFEVIEEALPLTTSRKVRRHVVQSAYQFRDGQAVRAGN